MVSPTVKRRAVNVLQDRLGFSERLACRVVGQSRSTQRHERKLAAEDHALRVQSHAFAVAHPRWGYRRAHHHLRAQGWCVNRKRVARLWRQEGLKVPVLKHKRRRLGDQTTDAKRLRAERPGHVWAFDFQADQTADGRALRLLNIIDEFTRESLIMLVERSIDAPTVVACLQQAVARRGAPMFLRCDNGPEMTSHALERWCQRSGTETAFIDPGAPWQNPFVESFHSRVRDELLDVEEFSCLAEARVVAGDWREEYNNRRPHSSLGYLTPAQFAASWQAPSEDEAELEIAA
jgi:transposase InsO family protein